MYSLLQRIKIHQSEQLPKLAKVDVSKLGRPWHKLPKLMNDCFDILDARLSIYFLKKLRVNTSLKSLDYVLEQHYKNIEVFATQFGNVAFEIDRMLLLCVLHDFYGLSKEQNNLTPDLSLPVTKTEERLKNKIAQELTTLILSKELFGEELEVRNDYSTVISKWSWGVKFSLEGYSTSGFSILLDRHHVDILMAKLRKPNAEAKQNTRPVSVGQVEKLFYTLPLTLHGKLVSVNMTVSQLAEIQQDDIIPVVLNTPLPVFIGKEQIFEANIVEDRGKLFFSDFQHKIIENDYE